jgi:hypothetical protein
MKDLIISEINKIVSQKSTPIFINYENLSGNLKRMIYVRYRLALIIRPTKTLSRKDN